MRIKLDRLRLKTEVSRLNLLHWGHFILVMVALLLEMLLTPSRIPSFILSGIILLIGYNFYFRTVRRLYYTFWGFSIILFIYLCVSVIGLPEMSSELGRSIAYLYLISFLLLLLECFFISSPIYFPRISWWEYDFRYRDELHVQLKKAGELFSARLSDLRRGAGCLVNFELLSIGEIVTIGAENESGEIELKAQVMSKRIYSIGRGNIYGVRFIFDNDDQRREFSKFRKFWRSERSSKRRLKFKEGII